MPSRLKPLDKIPAAGNRPRWKALQEALFSLHIHEIISDSEHARAQKRFCKWLEFHGLELKTRKPESTS